MAFETEIARISTDPVDLDHLFVLAEMSPLLDRVEACLRDRKYTALADDLLKVQQDAGVQIDYIMRDEPVVAVPGPQTAELYGAFETVTPARLSAILRGTMDALKKEGLLNADFADLPRMLPPPPDAPPPSSKKSSGPALP